MRVLVTGSRDYPWWNDVNRALLEYLHDAFNITIVHGACPRGADMWAQRFVDYQKVRCEQYPAEWDKYGKRAGYVRNADMVALGADLCLAFINEESKGATMTADLAENSGIRTIRYLRNGHGSDLTIVDSADNEGRT